MPILVALSISILSVILVRFLDIVPNERLKGIKKKKKTVME